MKQYRKGREPLFPLFSCDMKDHCGENCCHLTTHKRWAKKDNRGKPIKSGCGLDKMRWAMGDYILQAL